MAVASDRVADLADRGADVGVGGAAADVAAHPFGDLRVAGGVPLLQQRHRRHDLARGAVAALERVMDDEGTLHGMQLLALGQPLDGGDLMTLAGNRQRQARQDPSPVHPDRARAAGALVAALLGARQTQLLAERVKQADTRLELERRLTRGSNWSAWVTPLTERLTGTGSGPRVSSATASVARRDDCRSDI